AYEPWNYTPGTSSEFTNPGPWVLNSGTAGTVTNINLTVPGLASPSGNAYTYGSLNHSLRLPIGTNVSGTLYFAFAMRVDNLGAPGSSASETCAGFTFGTGTSFASKINIVSNSFGVYQLGLYKAGGIVNGILTTNLFTTNDIVFIVSRYTFLPNSSTDDTCDL